MAVQQKSHKPI